MTEQTVRLACLMLATGCLPELAFDARELTLQAHMSMHIPVVLKLPDLGNHQKLPDFDNQNGRFFLG